MIVAHGMVDVAIVGGGLMGCAAALALRARGRSVALFEQGWCGAQASGVNFGGVRRQGRPACQLPLSQRAHRLWPGLAAQLDADIEYVRSGHLKLAGNEAGMDELLAYRDMAQTFGVETEVLGQQALRRRFPWVGAAASGGSICEEDGQANPRLLGAAFARAARRAGAHIHEQARVETIAADDAGFRICLRDGREFLAAQLINCAGAWGSTLAARLGDPVPGYALYPNMLVTEPLPGFVDVSIGVVGGGFYARQVARGNVVVGGGRTTGSLSLTGNRPSAERSRNALRQACSFIPALRGALVIRSWTGVEGGTPDKQPVFGFSPTIPGLVHCFGFTGAGFQLSPAVGEILAELCCDGETPTPIDAFRVDRFDKAGAVSSLFSSQAVARQPGDVLSATSFPAHGDHHDIE